MKPLPLLALSLCLLAFACSKEPPSDASLPQDPSGRAQPCEPASAATAAEDMAPEPEPPTVRDTLPERVAQLFFDWESASPGHKVFTGEENKRAEYVRRSMMDALRQYLNAEWLPDQATLDKSILMVNDQFDLADALHIQWKANGYHIRSSQTRTSFTVSLSPISGSLGWDTPESSVAGMAKLCKRLIVNLPQKSIVNPGQYEVFKLAADGTMPLLISASFTRATIIQCGDGISASPARADKSLPGDELAVNYWWRMVGWWTDGKTTAAFFFPKCSGGAWSPNYGETMLDSWWFEPYTGPGADRMKI